MALPSLWFEAFLTVYDSLSVRIGSGRCIGTLNVCACVQILRTITSEYIFLFDGVDISWPGLHKYTILP